MQQPALRSWKTKFLPTAPTQYAQPVSGLLICRTKMAVQSDQRTRWGADLPDLGYQMRNLALPEKSEEGDRSPVGAGRWDVFPKGCWGIRCGSLSQPNTREGCPILGLGGSSESTCHPVLSGRCTALQDKAGSLCAQADHTDSPRVSLP